MTKIDNQAWKWHGRLSHVNFDSLRHMTSKGLVRGLPVVSKPKQVCEVCLAGKQVRSTFPAKSMCKSEQPLELVSIDLCGPITPETRA